MRFNWRDLPPFKKNSVVFFVTICSGTKYDLLYKLDDYDMYYQTYSYIWLRSLNVIVEEFVLVVSSGHINH